MKTKNSLNSKNMKGASLSLLNRWVNSLKILYNKNQALVLRLYKVGLENKISHNKQKKPIVNKDLTFTSQLEKGWMSEYKVNEHIGKKYIENLKSIGWKVINSNRERVTKLIKSRESINIFSGNEAGGSTTYLGTSLPLIPDIRSMSIIKGLRNLNLSLFNVAKYNKDTSITILKGGPNGRLNRYLRYQYKRLLYSIYALPSVDNTTESLKINWNIDFVKKDWKLSYLGKWKSPPWPFEKHLVENGDTFGIKMGVSSSSIDPKKKFKGWNPDKRYKDYEFFYKKIRSLSYDKLDFKADSQFFLKARQNGIIVPTSNYSPKKIHAPWFEWERKILDGKEIYIAPPGYKDPAIHFQPWLVNSETVHKTNEKGDKTKYNLYDISIPRAYLPDLSPKKLRKMSANYWRLGYHLMRDSKSFHVAQVCSLWKEDRWYSRYSLADLYTYLGTAKSLLKAWIQSPSMHRTWIESPPGKLRPLGVATKSWRLILKSDQVLLDNFIKGSLDPNQHGYIKGRGTGSAWYSIFQKKILDYPYIFEYDFKGFFDNVKLSFISKRLKGYGIPKHVCLRLLHLSGSNISPPNPKVLLKAKEKGTLNQILSKEFLYNYRKDYRYAALPQGSGISPILSILCLDFLNQLEKGSKPIKNIKYADDGIFYSNYPDDPIERMNQTDFSQETGCVFQRQKSGWVKFEDKWLKGLKFLGLTYDGKTDKFSATTRGNPQSVNVSRAGSKLDLDLSYIISFPSNVRWNAIKDAISNAESGHNVVMPILQDGNIVNPKLYSEFVDKFKPAFLEYKVIEYWDEYRRKWLKNGKRIFGRDAMEVISNSLPKECPRDIAITLKEYTESIIPKSDHWFIQYRKEIRKFNNSLVGKNYEVWTHHANPEDWSCEFEQLFNEGIEKPCMSIHIHPFFSLGGRVEEEVKIEENSLKNYKEFRTRKRFTSHLNIFPLKKEDLWKNNSRLATNRVSKILESFSSSCRSLRFIYSSISPFIPSLILKKEEEERIYFAGFLDHHSMIGKPYLLNFFISCLYCNSFKPGNETQDFSLNLSNHSLINRSYTQVVKNTKGVKETILDTRGNLRASLGKETLNFANLSSLSSRLLYEYLQTQPLPLRFTKNFQISELWIKPLEKLLYLLRNRRPGPAIKKPWARELMSLHKSAEIWKAKNAKENPEVWGFDGLSRISALKNSHHVKLVDGNALNPPPSDIVNMNILQNIIPPWDKGKLSSEGVELVFNINQEVKNQLISSGALEEEEKNKEIPTSIRMENLVPEFTRPYLYDPYQIDPRSGEKVIPTFHKKSKSVKHPKKHVLKLMRYDIAVNKKFRLLIKTGVSWETIQNMFHSEHDRLWNTETRYTLLRRYGAQRQWNHTQWKKKILNSGGNLSNVVKPKNSDWITWSPKKKLNSQKINNPHKYSKNI